ncbi:acyltransferase [Nocardioides seonyuensis]|uniref:Acyltransferase n=1 Tax=Nocardioides seonyuensis TaxID=2518371 RepID=A0A4P7IEN5_9ACTN|nr:acyltransferase family protein [Nocardioides seonyuensis]QBX55618.1 acyltransferase [Nocardioides seonyuensis]
MSDRDAPGARGASSATAPRTQEGHKLRSDIQALRALAVTAVLAYHLWPGRPSGGYLGVDVFFVISGFLITSHLLKSPPRSPADFAHFWARRIVRLLPPAFVVIISTIVAMLAWIPSSQWRSLTHEGLASMLYVQNWRLVATATDYLEARGAPSPFQHFWSLSVEEQYYLLWPGVVAVVAFLHLRRRWDYRKTAAVVFAVLLLASLAWSVWQTSTRPEVAYFSLFTRLWELAVGSLTAALFPALAGRLSVPVRVALLWLGALGIVAACLVMTPQSAIPGYAALLPTVATALVIVANDPDSRLNPQWLTRSRPVQFLGDTSYALYLWHWPLVVIAPYALERPLQWSDRLVVLALSVLLAWASTSLLEGPVRSWPLLRQRLRHAYALGLVLSLGVVATSFAVTTYVDRVVAQDQRAVNQALGRNCVGAAAMANPEHCRMRGSKLITSPAFAREDVTEGIRDCLNWPPFKKHPITCSRGETEEPAKKIALFGNSHAGQWTEALTDIATSRGWQLDTYIMGACFSAIEQPYPECTDIVGQALDLIEQGGYDLVVMATYDEDADRPLSMYDETMDSFVAGGSSVLVLRDTPAPWDPENPPVDCIDQHPRRWKACDGPRDWIRPDPMHAAAVQSTSEVVHDADFTSYFCNEEVCPAVIGGVIVLSDYNHMTTTFSRTLVPYLEPEVDRALASTPDPS